MFAVKQVELPRTARDKENSTLSGVVNALKLEVELLKDLDHPNVVSYLGFDETISHLSIFLEYIPGGSVGSCLKKHGRFEKTVVKSFAGQILHGLVYLHTKNILHRDLKADNILVDLEGVCKITDFGVSKRAGDIYENNANMSMQGTIFWMAPEVVSNQKKGYSAKIDVWSFGCVVLEMFCGKRPWSQHEVVQAMFNLGAGRQAPPIPDDVSISKVGRHFLESCFTIDPVERPTAERLLCHKFLALDASWKFETTVLYKAIRLQKPKKRPAHRQSTDGLLKV